MVENSPLPALTSAKGSQELLDRVDFRFVPTSTFTANATAHLLTNGPALLPSSREKKATSDALKLLGQLFSPIGRPLQPLSTGGSFRAERTDWLSQANKELDSVWTEASRPDWDGEGAEPVSHAVVDVTRKLLALLPVTAPEPGISAGPSGRIHLHWQRRRRLALTIAIAADGTLSFAGLFGRNRQFGTEQFREAIPTSILEGIERFLSSSLEEMDSSETKA